MGQTGVGKSSLVNALFSTHFKTDPIQPCTKKIEEHIEKDSSGHELHFYDLPGIGEAGTVNEGYLDTYREKLEESDVVLWAIHADNRSFTFDLNSLNQILKQFDSKKQNQLISKITFVLTKVDLLREDPWILFVLGDDGMFNPGPKTKELLEKKSEYCQTHFITPYSEQLISNTFRDNEAVISDSRFSFSEDYVEFGEFMDEATFNSLKQSYPQHKFLLTRLFNNHQAIPCSSLFKYNLHQLMRVVIDRLDPSAIGRFSHFVKQDSVSKISIEKAKKLGNIVASDIDGEILFDLSNLKH